LPEDIFLDGCAEVIKYGILYDEAFFSYLESTGPEFDRESVIARCVEMKRDVVMEDEFDTGARMKLNLGHTIGHGVEASSNFTLSHGKSVAIGMAIVSRASHCPENDRIIRILEQFALPTNTETDANTLFQYALSDKKRSGGSVNLIIPRAIGNCEIVSTPVEEILPFIEEGL
jgi:3-dehydroquinate synthase